MATKRMPLYRIIGIFRDLAYYLAKYQYFLNETKFIRLLLSIYIFFAYSTHISFNVDFMARKKLNGAQNRPYLTPENYGVFL